MNILQFTNTALQELHAKAATVANAAVVEGPFTGQWWEQYLAVVIETAQAEQRVACSKDVAEIRGFYDLLAKDLDAANAALTLEQELRGAAELERNELRAAAAERAEAEAARAALVHNQAEVIKGLHKQLAQAASVNDKLRQQLEDTMQSGNVAAGVDAQPPLPPANEPPPHSDAERETQYDNPATYTARPNPFLK